MSVKKLLIVVALLFGILCLKPTSDVVERQPSEAKNAPVEIPASGTSDYEKMVVAWKATLEGEGFREEEMPMEKAIIRESDQPGETGYVVTWKHTWAKCKVIANVSKNWAVLAHRSECLSVN